jgi:hypothetical protein
MYNFYLRPLLMKRARVPNTTGQIDESSERS